MALHDRLNVRTVAQNLGQPTAGVRNFDVLRLLSKSSMERNKNVFRYYRESDRVGMDLYPNGGLHGQSNPTISRKVRRAPSGFKIYGIAISALCVGAGSVLYYVFRANQEDSNIAALIDADDDDVT